MRDNGIPRTSGIYCIRNLVDGKRYIGSTNCFKVRFKTHKVNLKGNKHGNQHLQYAWNKYGKDSFSFEIVEECGIAVLDSKERKYIASLGTQNPDVGYNLTPGGVTLRGADHPSFGKPVPKERRAKLRLKSLGRPKSPEELAKLSRHFSGEGNNMHGRSGVLSPVFGRKKSQAEIDKTRFAKFRPVEQVDLVTGAVLHQFDSILSAMTAMGLKSHGNLSSCCRGHRKSAGGYAWRYASPKAAPTRAV